MSLPEPDPKDKAQAALRNSWVRPYQIYQHYKGGYYMVVATAIDEVTLEPVVVYSSNAKGTTWVRTLEVFTQLLCGSAELQGYGHMGSVPRFKRIID